jgi:malic enzyme
VISDDELDADYIIPSAFNRHVVRAVARHVADAAVRSGVARRPLSEPPGAVVEDSHLRSQRHARHPRSPSGLAPRDAGATP